MIKIENYEAIKEVTPFAKLEVGPQICKITKVEAFEDKEYLKVYFDISQGELKGHFQELSDKFGNWQGTLFRSYKEKALPYFKAFITAVEKSNSGYKFNFDEQMLIGKTVVINFRREEYINKDNERASIIKAFEAHSLEALKNGTIAIPVTYTLEKQHKPAPVAENTTNISIADDEALPF